MLPIPRGAGGHLNPTLPLSLQGRPVISLPSLALGASVPGKPCQASVLSFSPQTPLCRAFPGSRDAGGGNSLRALLPAWNGCPGAWTGDGSWLASPSLSASSGTALGRGRAYLGLADGAVQGVVLLVVEQAEVQRAQGGCGQRRAQVTHCHEGAHPCAAARAWPGQLLQSPQRLPPTEYLPQARPSSPGKWAVFSSLSR